MKWKPARTGDPLINRNFDDLAAKLSGLADVVAALDLPEVSRVFGDALIRDEDFIDYRGPGGNAVRLCPANRAGDGRASFVYIQNNGISAITVKPQGRETVNGLTSVSVAAGSLLLATSNGVDTWLALVTTAPVARAGHIIQDSGVDKTQRNHLNFIGATVADNSGADSTDITFSAGHVIQDNGTDKTQRAKLDFIGFTVADDSINNRTKVTAPAASAAGHIIQDNGTDKTQRGHLNFIFNPGAAAIADDAGNDATKVTIKGPAFIRFWDPNRWQVGCFSPQGATATVNYSTTGVVDFIYAYPVTFDRAGNINAFGQHIGNNNGKVWLGLYDSDPATPWVPRTRLYDKELTAPGFNQPVTTAGLSIAITAGRTYWFAAVYNAGGIGGGCINLSLSSQLNDLWGSDWDGVTAGAPTIARLSGYKHAFSYAQLPLTFPGSGSPTLLKSNAAAAPVTMFKFTQS